jgi:7-cyano-7-deazaguanine reductase
MKKELLQTIENKDKDKSFICQFEFPELTAVCPTTKLPDFYVMKLLYEPDAKLVELKSLKMYLIQYRNVGILHEQLINELLEDFKVVVQPRWIFLELKVNVRGGIYTTVRRHWSRTGGDSIEKALQSL